MKLILTTFALIAIVAADVSHLSRQYLPAVKYSSHYAAEESKGYDDSSSDGLFQVNYDTDTNHKLSDAETYSGLEHNLEYAQQAEHAPISGAHEYTYVNAEKQTYEPIAPANEEAVSYGKYSKATPIEEYAPVEQDAFSYGTYGNDKAQFEYQIVEADADQQQQHADESFNHAGALDDATGISYGGYDFENQKTGALDLGLSSYRNSFDHSAALRAAANEGQSAWHGSVSYPAQTVTHYVSSGHTKYGGYIY